MIVDYDVESAWKGHEDFLAWLIATKKPNIYVEVGVYHGFSYFAACQIIKGLKLGTVCKGVDTWAPGYCYNEEDPEVIYNKVFMHNEQNFKDFSYLIRSKSLVAARMAGHRSIDILHIDAGHSYEEVSADFMAWLPKMKRGGVVMFHDTMVDNVSGIDKTGAVVNLGVNKFWNEIINIFPAFNFPHSMGLGVLTIDRYPTGT
jgi:cephalosporin hydroxylase